MRPAIAVAATGSVGETIAPSTNAAGHDMPSITAWATSATAQRGGQHEPDREHADRADVLRAARAAPVKKLAL